MHIGLNNNGIAFDGGAVGNCECCNNVPACDYPLLLVTLSWTDGDTTKTYLGETFTNGQSHYICPQTYSCNNDPLSPPETATGLVAFVAESWKFTETADVTGLTGRNQVVKEYQNSGAGTNTSTNTYTATVGVRNYVNLYNASAIRRYTSVVGTGTTASTFTTYKTTHNGQRKIQFVTPQGITTGKPFFWQRYVKIFNKSSPSASPSTTYYNNRWRGSGVPKPPVTTDFDGFITNAFNGSHTTASGVTITWAKSNDGTSNWGDC